MASGCKTGSSILNSDLANLGAECLQMLDSGADYLHLDIMDRHFQLGQDRFFDMHMMVSRLEQWVKPMAVGLAIKPGTTVEYLASWANQIDMALLITVERGFGGQKFMEDMLLKAGPNLIVSGSAIMRSDAPKSVINLLRNVCSEAAQNHSLDR
ncbi:unnamed protein product [Nyctereutes procyonoides]|uniref:(raccoon dog) hypothetical protein n=1 Tax=Nyctereutes procyonoides TaxID=34880 RepID=A0A811YRA7_NYCPR|nr:unnamed protein product [Nyctereutes procyonoides]